MRRTSATLSDVRHPSREQRSVFIDGGVVVEEEPPAEMLEHPRTDRLQQFLNVLYWGESNG